MPQQVTDARVAHVRFFHAAPRDGCGADRQTFARLAGGRAWPVDSEGEVQCGELEAPVTAALRLPVVRRGWRIAYVTRTASCGDGIGVAISVLDLRTGARDEVPVGAQGDGVGSLALARSGRVAWITCPVSYTLGGRPAVYFVSRFCSHPGRTARVFVGGPGYTDPPRQVDHGRAIDPRSLRLRGYLVTWRHSSRTRSARLR